MILRCPAEIGDSLLGKNWAGLRRNFENHQIFLSLFGNKLARFPVILYIFFEDTRFLGLAPGMCIAMISA